MVVKKIENFINETFNFLEKKFLNIILFFLEIFRNNTSGFFQFLFERNIIFIAIGFIVSTQISKLITSFVEIFIDPIVKRLSAGTVESLQKLELTIFDVKMKIGLFINTLFNFFITFIIIYQIYIFSRNPDTTGLVNWLRKAENIVNEKIKQKSNIVFAVTS
jgi:large-conductance mechanosensitive channel